MLFILDRFLPDWTDLALVFPLSIALALALASISALTRSAFGLRTNYSRKVFHFLVFTFATLLGVLYPAHRVAAFGAGSGLALIIIILFRRQKGFGLMYHALARPEDRPHSTMYLIVPYISTALGGLAANIIVPGLAPVAYLVAGWGDAVGEPVGVKYGAHRYSVPLLGRGKGERSVEGSIGVLIASFAAAIILLFVLAPHNTTLTTLYALGIALACTVVEAFAPHGLDNFFTQVTAALVLVALM